GLPKEVQVLPPSAVNCQSPLVLSTPVTAMPLTAPVSTSLTCPASSVETRLPPLAVWSSLMVVKLLAPDRTGASLTLVTVIVEVAAAVLKGVVPPLALASTLLPAVPAVWSQAEKVRLAVVPFWPSGTNRRLSLERKSRAELLLTVPTAVQVLP